MNAVMDLYYVGKQILMCILEFGFDMCIPYDKNKLICD